MDEFSYKQSAANLVLQLLVDVLLILLIVGIFLIPYHIVIYFKNKLVLNKSSLTIYKGFLVTNTVEIPYSKVNTITINKNILGSIFNYGDLVVLSGNDAAEIFKNIDNPEKVKAEIMKHV